MAPEGCPKGCYPEHDTFYGPLRYYSTPSPQQLERQQRNLDAMLKALEALNEMGGEISSLREKVTELEAENARLRGLVKES